MQSALYLCWWGATAALATTLQSTFGEAVVERQSEGCGKTHFFNGITQYYNLTSSGRDRQYSIHLPGDYDEASPYPVVLGFHGSDSVGFFFEADTKMSEDRFSSGKIMIYPNGVGGSWAGANYSEVSIEEDLQFVSDLLDEIRVDYCVDDSRIYATG
ncbi:hypothetical protein SLS62_008112 [Diatrype stigma]|uniref:feruloyl esterase n=1 Tax=Diatrype stigma TaxID=117547 RepID=A0AAN9YLU3_9PEZI